MPFYEDQCSACGHHHEELQKVSDRPLRKCPACGRPALKRLVSAPVFRLRGGGWYETDFKKDGESKRNLAGEKEPATADGPPVEKAKDEKPKDGTPKDDQADTKPAEKKADAVPKPAAARKPKPARLRAARRRPARR
jgi:putative FmdB family regulatory protein